MIPMSIERVKATTIPPEEGKLLTVSKYKALGFDLEWLDEKLLTYIRGSFMQHTTRMAC